MLVTNESETGDSIKRLFDTSKRVNSRSVSLVRTLILVLIGYSVDGIQYRELKAALKISDGQLISNLNQLVAMKYIEKQEVTIDNRKVDIYVPTEEGKDELIRITQWMNSVQNVVKIICQKT